MKGQLKAGKRAVKKQLKAGKKAVKEQLKEVREVTRRRSSTDAAQNVVAASVVGWQFRDDEKGKFVDFEVKVQRSSLASRLRGTEDTTTAIFARYSDFVQLREGLVHHFINNDEVIVEPIDRRHLRKFGQKMLEERAVKLNTFLDSIVLDKQQRETEAFTSFLALAREAPSELAEQTKCVDATPVPASTLLQSVREAFDQAMDTPAPANAALKSDANADTGRTSGFVVVALDNARAEEKEEEEVDSADEEKAELDTQGAMKFPWKKSKDKARGGGKDEAGGGAQEGGNGKGSSEEGGVVKTVEGDDHKQAAEPTRAPGGGGNGGGDGGGGGGGEGGGEGGGDGGGKGGGGVGDANHRAEMLAAPREAMLAAKMQAGAITKQEYEQMVKSERAFAQEQRQAEVAEAAAEVAEAAAEEAEAAAEEEERYRAQAEAEAAEESAVVAREAAGREAMLAEKVVIQY
jgi:hypothetical protein